MMLENLNGLSGFLKTMTDAVTTMQASLTANLDESVGSRAPLSTALSSVTWPSSLASNLIARITKTQVQQEDSIVAKFGRNTVVLVHGQDSHTGSSSTWKTVKNQSGQGRIHSLTNNLDNGTIRLTLDGVVIASDYIIALSDVTATGVTKYAIVRPGMDLPFQTSIKIETWKDSGGNNPATAYVYSIT